MLASLISIAALHWAVLVIPGFNVVLIGQLAASGSRRAALSAVLGMTSATCLWATLAVAGVGAVFSAHPALRQLAQVVGGSYLLLLAYNLYRSGGQAPSPGPSVASPRAAFRAGFLTSAFNPKIALFYGSVFATALPAAPTLWQACAAVAVVYANSWLWHGGLAFALSQPRVQRAYLAHHRALTRLASVLVGAFGLRLIAEAAHEARRRLG